MGIKLFDSELRIMDVLWNEGDKSAKELADILGKSVGWSKTTTYTVIKKCIVKGAVARNESAFICHAVVSRDEAREMETAELINKLYGGSQDLLIASLLGGKSLPATKMERLRQYVKDMEAGK
jgi:predicted transcriptional regulator